MTSEVFNEDCVEGMKRYPNGYFDLAVVDPPYGIDRNSMNMGNSVFNTDSKKWDKSIPTPEYFNELFRVSKNQIIWGGNYFPLPCSQYFAVWDKGETMYSRDFAECELAWVRSGGTRIFKKSPNDKDRIHPTQKPVALYEWILGKYATCKTCKNKFGYYEDVVGDGGSRMWVGCEDCDCKPLKIFDTHMGSQSSRIAAYKGGFDFTGFEIDKEYFDQGNLRFEQFKSQLRLF